MIPYVGRELELFSHARNWKEYIAGFIQPYIRGSVLEVGAGEAATTRVLLNDAVGRWTCLEPDRDLASRIREDSGLKCQVIESTLDALPAGRHFDTILYIDVLEHIEKDDHELESAFAMLKEGGHLIVLAPAHRFLFSPFDKAVGHFRRYTLGDLLSLSPGGSTVVKKLYLDSVGSLLSMANRIALRASCPTKGQILFWDRRIIPLSRFVDRMLHYHFGKSVLVVWEK